jgi:hypothetical protein
MKKFLFLVASLVGVVVLAASGRAAGLPQQPAHSLKVHFLQTPGVGDFREHPAVDLDGDTLSPDEVQQLGRLIEEAHFFELHSTPPLSLVPPDPLVGYDLTVESDGRAQTIWVACNDVSPALQRLIDWLRARERPIERHPPLPVG